MGCQEGREGGREGMVLFLMTIGITSVLIRYLVHTVVQCVLSVYLRTHYTLQRHFPLTFLGIPPVLHVIIPFPFHLQSGIRVCTLQSLYLLR